MQAVALEEMLSRRGHEVVEILVGGSSSRTLPGFFNRNAKAPVKRFVSPKLLSTETGEYIRLGKNLIHNLLYFPEYIRSMCYINRRIRKTGVDAVINFHEVLTGFTYLLFRPSAPYVAVGREYMFLHRDFEFPQKGYWRLLLMRLFTRLTSMRAKKRLALSFRSLPADAANNVVVVPPLLRREITSMPTETGDYIHGYLPRSRFFEEILDFHQARPEVPMRFFWDNPDAEEVTRIDKTLRFYQPDDTAFMNAFAGCRAYAGTAVFDTICEAMFLQKPMLMVPLRLEQACNAQDALKSGAGIVGDSFSIQPLLKFAETYAPDREFVYWVRSSERRVIGELEDMEHSPVPDVVFG